MTILISHLTKSVVLKYDDRLKALFPHAHRFEWEGDEMIALPHGIDETKMLRNLDLPVPAPIVEHYPFPSADGKRPFAKQVLTAASMIMNPRSFVLNGMGTGKTKAALWAYDYLRSLNHVKRMLVVAPLSTLNFTWAKEIMQTLPHLKVIVLTGTKEKRLKLLAEKADIYIVNHDGAKVIHDALMLRHDIDVICFDEAAAYRSARIDRSKLARKLVVNRKYVWGMTGSPTPTDPTDAYGLAHLIVPHTAPRSWVQFRHDTMLQINQFKWVARKDSHETVARVLQPSVRYSLDEIVELPQLIERDIEVEQGPRQQAAYAKLKEEAAVMLKEGTVTAANGGVKFSKMLQVSLGWIYDDRHNAILLDPVSRLQTLLDIIQSAERKVIVFSPFKSATQGISRLLTHDKYDFAEVTGDTPHGQRTDIFNAFQGTDKYRVLNAHPECMSHGLTLTAADTIVWYGPVTKLETYEQANARIRRVGQAHKQQVIRLIGTQAERLMYQRLAGRQNLQDSILDLLAELTGGE